MVADSNTSDTSSKNDNGSQTDQPQAGCLCRSLATNAEDDVSMNIGITVSDTKKECIMLSWNDAGDDLDKALKVVEGRIGSNVVKVGAQQFVLTESLSSQNS